MALRQKKPAQPRRTQAERSAATRARLLDATTACLVELGYAGTTTLAVCERAGVSHGSLLHHYGTRERLLAAALESVQGRLRQRVVDQVRSLPLEREHLAERVETLVDLMGAAFDAPEFKAIVELWLAAANRPPVSDTVWPEAHLFDAEIFPLAESLFPDVVERLPNFRVYVSLLFQSMQGMGLARATWPAHPEGDAMRAQVRVLLARILREAFEETA